jgi:hypothetical protein
LRGAIAGPARESEALWVEGQGHHRAVMTGEHAAHLARHRPRAHGPVLRGRRQHLAIGAQDQRRHELVVAEDQLAVAAGHVPASDLAVVGGRVQPRALGRLEPSPGLGRGRRAAQELDGHAAIEALVVGDVHDPHAARAELAHDREPADLDGLGQLAEQAGRDLGLAAANVEIGLLAVCSQPCELGRDRFGVVAVLELHLASAHDSRVFARASRAPVPRPTSESGSRVRRRAARPRSAPRRRRRPRPRGLRSRRGSPARSR